jgi:hypothetical protein
LTGGEIVRRGAEPAAPPEPDQVPDAHGRPFRGYGRVMRIGNTEVRFLGGPAGCLTMVVLSVLASVVLTVLLNLVL